MELLQLKYFLHLAQSEHVSQSAAELHISQPSLSSTIKKLENELGVPLFVRNGRNIRLSGYGEIYRDYVRQSLDALENGRIALDEKRGFDNRHLSLGMLSPYIWSDLLYHFGQKYPEIAVDRYSLENSDYCKLLRSGKIDMYIGGVHDLEARDFASTVLYEDDIVLLVNKAHPLAQRDAIDLRQCGDVRFINLGEHTSLQQFISSMYQEAGLVPASVLECDYTLRDQMVIENHGVSVTTQASALSANSDQIKALPIIFPTKKRILGLIYRKNRLFTPAMKKFHRFTCEYYSKNS